MRLADLLSLDTVEKLQEVTPVPIPRIIDIREIVIPEIDDVMYPTIYNRQLNVWMCRAANCTFCKRECQSISEKPDCKNCALRR